MTATTQLRAWQRAHPGRHVYFGRRLVALGDGEHSVHANRPDTEAAVRAALEAWYGWEQAA